MKWEAVIGIEVHVELNTKTKMFCACSADYFGKQPNTHTCPVCLGLPGALPYINQKALESCIKIGLALNCQINSKSLFERKNYFYPDLVKGYQISQYRWPLCVNGSIEVEGSDGKLTKIRINRAHQEEDTGKLSHRGGKSYIDFNRCGVPLVEIVTEADFNESEQVRDYGKKLQQIIRSLGVSAADMEKGDMRLEANVSVRPVGQKTLPNYRVELKNINSFKYIKDAIDSEIERQIKAHESGQKLNQETRGWNENKKETFLQRSKEEANDYRYFPDPDLPLILTSENEVSVLKSQIGTLPADKQKEYILLGMSETSAKIIANSQKRREIFDQTAKLVSDKQRALLGKFYINLGSSAKDSHSLKEMFSQFISSNKSKMSGTDDLRKIASTVIDQNNKSVEAYKNGKLNAIESLVGAIMRETKGKADAQKAREVLEDLLR